mgnify:CR=1 FL=1
MGFIDDFLVPAVDNGDRAENYSPLDPINIQCVRKDQETQITADRIVLKTERFRATGEKIDAVSYTHLRAHETVLDLVCRLLLEKKKTTPITTLSMSFVIIDTHTPNNTHT